MCINRLVSQTRVVDVFFTVVLFVSFGLILKAFFLASEQSAFQ